MSDDTPPPGPSLDLRTETNQVLEVLNRIRTLEADMEELEERMLTAEGRITEGKTSDYDLREVLNRVSYQQRVVLRGVNRLLKKMGDPEIAMYPKAKAKGKS